MKILEFIKTPTGIFVTAIVVIAIIAIWMNWSKWFGTCTTCGGTGSSTASSSSSSGKNFCPPGTTPWRDAYYVLHCDKI